MSKPRGGIRENSGRKPLAEKKKPVTAYIEESKIENIGGKEKAREVMIDAVNKKSKQVKK